ncbi:MAG: DUF1028 domain-containing protein [Candidatus Krumholzibacteria bacterium]|nr:DUF1028 domain-containing protein [Candidatus Krumholzibacteria bacterium]MDH4337758.1 DUF1028 domain-containing protein [Candidatus Krumholzibacteria bacterium]MDH5271374.1 DUF1028 domain-containing protein [Candidatus Krumholzibacteria bacterium]
MQRRLLVLLVPVLMLLSPVPGGSATVERPMHTYSIVARDSVTGAFGVAVQSHWFSVGARVAWAEAGVGAVATQSFTEVSYGPLGLDLMRAGKTAPQALAALLAADPQREVRQVAMVDAQGNVAAHTGKNCIAAFGDHPGAQYSVQANLMLKDTVWDAMATAYETTKGDLAERLLAALEAAQREGGDIRGRQSAAIVIVPGETAGRPWAERTMDLRVEDSTEPLVELRRLIGVHRAYERMNAGDDLMAVGDMPGAMKAYGDAARLLPDNPEIRYWAAITMITSGQEKEGIAYLKDVFAADPNWVEVTRRLVPAGLLPDDPALMQRILAVAPKEFLYDAR